MFLRAFLLFFLAALGGCGDTGPHGESAPGSSPRRELRPLPPPDSAAPAPLPPAPIPPPGPTANELWGLVVDGEAHPVAEALIEVHSLLRDGVVEQVRTDAEGRFQVTLPFSGPMLIEASDASAAAWSTAAQPGEILAPLQLLPPASLKGSVEESAHHSPLTSYVLVLLPRAPQDVLGWLMGSRWRDRTRQEHIEEKRGRFQLEGIPAGDYELWVLAAGYRALRIEGLALQDAVELPVLSLESHPAGALQPTDPQGLPLADAWCQPILKDGLGQLHPVPALRRTSDAGGRLWTPLPPELPLLLELRHGTLGRLLETAAQRGPLALLPRQSLRVLFPEPCFGVARAVEAAGAASDPQWFEGEVLFENLPAGRYALEVAADYGAGWVLSRFAVEHGGSSLTEVFRRAGGRLRLLRDSRVLLHSRDGDRHLLFPDAEGRVELSGIPRAHIEASQGSEVWHWDLEQDVLEWD